MDIRADTLFVGQAINYRGDCAVVVECWTDYANAPRGFGPVGCVIEFTPENSPEPVRVRLEWPARTNDEESPQDYAARLSVELDSELLQTWE